MIQHPITTRPASAPDPAAGPLAGRRILVVLGALVLGGAERQAILLARRLREDHGAAVEVWGYAQPGAGAALCEECRVPWRLVPFSPPPSPHSWLEALACLAATMRRAHPDVLLPYYALANVSCGLIWRFAGARTCVWNQRDEGIQPQPPHLERLAVRRTPWFVGNSPNCADFLTRRLGADAARVRVIPNGVQLGASQASRAEWRQRLGLGPDDITACMLAHLHECKDHATLLRAWRLLLDARPANGPRPVLLLAGRGDGMDVPLRALAHELALEETVRFLGPVSDVAGLVGAADLCVHSSPSEGCPNGVLEAMAAGLPVAGSDIAGIRFAVGDQGHRFLAPTGDAPALAQRIGALIGDPALRRAVGATNRRRIEDEFSPQRLAQRTAEVLAAALRPEAPPPVGEDLVRFRAVRAGVRLALGAWLGARAAGRSGRQAVRRGATRLPWVWRWATRAAPAGRPQSTGTSHE